MANRQGLAAPAFGANVTPARHAQIGALFTAAISIENSTERQAFLQDVTKNDPELFDQVRQLLAHHQDTNSFLNINPIRGSPPLSGTIIGPYTLFEEIGSGGMGLVFRARGREREVALKLVDPSRNNQKLLARFRHERRLLKLLQHPNIAQIHEAGPNYIAMELVDGIPLTQFCDEEALDVAEKIRLLITICQAVQYAHERNIIHRDLKPGNILVTAKGQPKIIDFGLGKAINGDTEFTTLTELGAILGTFQYMSPEQAFPSDHSIDVRSDIYSLGVILYELLTSSPPLRAASLEESSCPEILHRILTEIPRPPTNDPALNAITLRALAKKPEDRFQSAAELAQHLANCQPGGA
jgi:eukaryotic-like serine/threonine-protein kinase